MQSILGASAAAGLPAVFSACSGSSKASSALPASSSSRSSALPPRRRFRRDSSGARPPPLIRSKVRGTKTARANPSGTASRTLRARSRTATPVMSPAIRITAGAKTSPSLRAMNLNSYRFSISWPRIQPAGSGAANSKGIDYYSRIVDALLEARIRPMVTLYHWDLPQALEDAGGWPNRDTAGRFADYVQLVAKALGDRVSDWMIFNEPDAFVDLGHLEGTHAPGRQSILDFLRATHVVNLAQGAGFRALKADTSVVASGHGVQHVAMRARNGIRRRQTRGRPRARHHQYLVSGAGAAWALSRCAGVSARDCDAHPVRRHGEDARRHWISSASTSTTGPSPRRPEPWSASRTRRNGCSQ